MPVPNTVKVISALVAAVFKNPALYGKLSTTEALAVGMVLDRHDLIDNRTMLGAASRLGPEWLDAAYEVQIQLWDEERALGKEILKTRRA